MCVGLLALKWFLGVLRAILMVFTEILLCSAPTERGGFVVEPGQNPPTTI